MYKNNKRLDKFNLLVSEIKDTSTVQYLTFNLNGEKGTQIEVIVNHDNYKVSKKLPEDLAKQLIEEAYKE